MRDDSDPITFVETLMCVCNTNDILRDVDRFAELFEACIRNRRQHRFDSGEARALLMVASLDDLTSRAGRGPFRLRRSSRHAKQLKNMHWHMSRI